VAQDVEITVIGADSEIAGIRRIPSTVELAHLELPPAEYKAERALVSAMPCVTLHAHFAHRATSLSKHLGGFRSRISPRGNLVLPHSSSLASALYAAPINTTSAVTYIHSSKPIAAANPP
jgi:hypothetical protein